METKRGDTPRACTVEIPTMGPQLVASSAKSLPGRTSCARPLHWAIPATNGAAIPSWLRKQDQKPQYDRHGKMGFNTGTSRVRPSSFAAFRRV